MAITMTLAAQGLITLDTACALVIGDAGLREALASASVRCSIDGRMMTLARWPNTGFGHVDRITDKGAIYAHGRTSGAPPKWSMENAIGGRFTVLGKDVSSWERESSRIRKSRVTGYLSYDWYRENHPIAGQLELRIRNLNRSAPSAFIRFTQFHPQAGK